MIDLSQLTAEDVEYLAQIAPLYDFRQYCKANIKGFNAHFTMSFRPTKITESQKRMFIVNKYGKSQGFIDKYISLFLDRTLREIEDAFALAKENNPLICAWISTISNSHFDQNPTLLRKLMRDKAPVFSLEEIELYAISETLQKENSSRKVEKQYEELFSEKQQLEDSLKEINEQLEINFSQIGELTSARDELLQQISELEAQINKYKADESALSQKLLQLDNEKQTKECLLSKCQEEILQLQSSNKLLLSEIDALKNDILSKETEILSLQQHCEDLTRLNSELLLQNSSSSQHPSTTELKEILDRISCPLCPVDMEYFAESLEYVLEDMGINDLRDMLKGHLIKILFSGKPIIACKETARLLLFVLSHIYKTQINRVVFDDKTNLHEIAQAIMNSDRIVFLENFIGNYPETYLIPVFQAFQDKIIIMDAVYEAMFKYISDDFLQYVNFLSLQRYNWLEISTIEPEIIAEKEFVVEQQESNIKAVSVFEKRLEEIGFSKEVIAARLGFVKNHMDVQGFFLFEFLPYCTDVLKKNPFYFNDKIVDYFANNNVANRWFKK